MKKNDLIAYVAEKAELTKQQATTAVEAVLDGITDTLKSGGDVRITGFGSFEVASRAASEGRDPRTGAAIQIPASKRPKFKPGKALKDAVNV